VYEQLQKKDNIILFIQR